MGPIRVRRGSPFGPGARNSRTMVAAPDNRGDTLLGAIMGRRYWIADERPMG